MLKSNTEEFSQTVSVAKLDSEFLHKKKSQILLTSTI